MIYILTGKISSGKSTFLLNFFKNKSNVCGVIQVKKNQRRYFVELPEGREYSMECENQDEEKIKIGDYSFSVTSVRKANTKLINCLIGSASVVIIDEFGKLEVEQKVFYDVIKSAIELSRKEKSKNLIIVIRNYLLDEFFSMFGLEPNSYKVIDINRAEGFFMSEFPPKS